MFGIISKQLGILELFGLLYSLIVMYLVIVYNNCSYDVFALFILRYSFEM